MSKFYTWYPKVVWDVEDGSLDPDYASFEGACEEIKEAMEGWGTDESTMTEVLGSKTAEERFMLSKQYAEMYDTSLYDAIDDETGGKYGRAMKILSLSPVEAEARMVHNSMKGYGVSEEHLIPLLVGRSNPDLMLLKRSYFEMYDRDLVMDLTDELDGEFETLIVMCVQGIEDNYDPEETHTEDRVMEDCDAFYEAGQGAWGTDEGPFFKILVKSPAEHLQAVNAAYVEKYGYNMKKAGEKELGGHAEEAVLFLLGIKLGDEEETLAAGIKLTCKGFGSADATGMMNYVIRLSCYPELLRGVLEKHEELYEKTVEYRIEDEFSGDLQALLLLVVASALPSNEEEEE